METKQETSMLDLTQTVIRLITPRAITGADISAELADDGSLIVSYQTAAGQVVQAYQSEAPSPVPLPKTISGRGQLLVLGGVIYLLAWSEKDTPKCAYLIRTGYKVPSGGGGGGPVAAEDAAPIAALGSEAWPNYGQPYPDESLIKDGRWYLRANKIVALLVQLARAVAQLQRLAKARGDLR